MVNLLGQGAPLLVALVAVPLLIPAIGTDRFGLLVIAWIVLGYFSLFDLGLGRSLTQLVGERIGRGRAEEVPALIRTSLLLMGAAGVLGAAVLLLAASLLSRVLNVPVGLADETVMAFRMLAAAVPFVVLTAGLRGLLEAVQRFGWVNAIRIPQGALTYLAPLLAAVAVSPGLPTLVGALILVRFGSLIAHGVLVVKAYPGLRGSGRAGIRGGDVRALFRMGGWITVSNVVGSLMIYVDRFLIGAVLTTAAVAYYAVPFEVVSRLWIAAAAVAAVFFPAFATSFRTDPARAAELFRDSGRLVLLCVFPPAFLLMAFAPEGLALWVGDEFAGPGAPVARWLVAGVILNAIAQVPFAFIQGVGRPDVPARLHLIEAPIYIAALWVFIDVWGITGAAVAWALRVGADALLLFWLSGRLFPLTRGAGVEIWKWTVAGLVVLGASALPMPGPGTRAVVLTGLVALSAWAGWRGLVPDGIKRRVRLPSRRAGGI